MSEYQLIQATEADATSVHRLLALAGAGLAESGFHNWNPPFSLDQVLAEIQSRTVFLLLSEGEPVATYSLALAAVRPYPQGFWPGDEKAALYMNRLAVDPAQQGRGIGAWCLSAIRHYAEAQGAAAVRCDVLAINAGLRRFYERHGYALCGQRSHSGWDFACYQLTC
ncbi:GNAT family N-acetyltransferase [Lysobacter koreensis]|uniref:GNAT family N-acetyltransferase n=1 Tax=Lysobacter koreensis TaxID=266122 RepID=A0ABW2YJ55_9GAMM